MAILNVTRRRDREDPPTKASKAEPAISIGASVSVRSRRIGREDTIRNPVRMVLVHVSFYATGRGTIIPYRRVRGIDHVGDHLITV